MTQKTYMTDDEAAAFIETGGAWPETPITAEIKARATHIVKGVSNAMAPYIRRHLFDFEIVHKPTYPHKSGGAGFVDDPYPSSLGFKFKAEMETGTEADPTTVQQFGDFLFYD